MFVAMEKTHIPLLAEVLELYYTEDEILEMAAIFDVTFSREVVGRYPRFNWLAVSRQLVEKLDHGNHYQMLESTLVALEQRNKTAIARTDWERRDAHQHATPKIEKLVAALREPGVAREIVVAEDKPFTAKSEVREFLERADTPTLVVDPYIGVGTLDCFRTMKVPIRLLTGAQNSSIEGGFENALKAFQTEGFTIEVRRHTKLHDRHIAFNDRCWLV
ncbi:MAG: hypothetical protein WAK56_18145, partial [Candidatus Sulfotelmatobacter sp.]